MRHKFVAEREDSLLLVVDMQEAMPKAVGRWKETAARIRQLMEAARILNIPMLATEHYKKGLGATIPEVSELLSEEAYFQKEYFSACLEEGFLEAIRKTNRSQIVITGMETHVCVLQTGLDLIRHGYRVHLVRNAVASRSEEDWETAVELFRDAGAVISSTEIVIFQWARRSNTKEFREILPIVK